MGKWRSWRPSEVEKLRALIGQLPMPLVVSRWNRWARRSGIPVRSEASLRRKALELGCSLRPNGEWVAMGAVLRCLGRSRQCIYQWVQAGLVLHQPGALQRASLVELARRKPNLFAGCPESGLLELLQDQSLVASLVAAYPRSRAVPRVKCPVFCLETGETYSSCRAAGRVLHLDGSAISKALQEGRAAAGLHFRLVA